MLNQLAVEFGRRLREQKWQAYVERFPPRRGERVLDVGVSAMHDLPNENYFLDCYPYPDQVTAVGVDDVESLRTFYPGVSFVRADGRNLPFDDRAFDVLHSNAVVEHVGPRPDQRRFIAELTRVGRRGFVTTPNRWFPIESHTRLPVVHWLPRSVMLRAFDAAGKPEHGIWLLSVGQFRRLFPDGIRLEVTTNRIAGWPATIAVFFYHN